MNRSPRSSAGLAGAFFRGADQPGRVARLLGPGAAEVLFHGTHGARSPSANHQRQHRDAWVCQDCRGREREDGPEHWSARRRTRDRPDGRMPSVRGLGAGTPRSTTSPASPKAARGARSVSRSASAGHARGEGVLWRRRPSIGRARYSLVWLARDGRTRSTAEPWPSSAPGADGRRWVRRRNGTPTRHHLNSVATPGRWGTTTHDWTVVALRGARGFVLLGAPRPVASVRRPQTVRSRRARYSRDHDNGPTSRRSRIHRAGTPAPASTDPVEVATYVTDNPDGVGFER